MCPPVRLLNLHMTRPKKNQVFAAVLSICHTANLLPLLTLIVMVDESAPDFLSSPNSPHNFGKNKILTPSLSESPRIQMTQTQCCD